VQEVLVATDLRPWDPRPDEASAALCGKTARTKRRNGAYPSDTERFVHWRTSLKDWPVNFGHSDIGRNSYALVRSRPPAGSLSAVRIIVRCPQRPTRRLPRTRGSARPIGTTQLKRRLREQ